MMCWENTSNAYCQTAMGWLTDDNFTNANKDGFVSYAESHDEERCFYKAKTWGEENNEKTYIITEFNDDKLTPKAKGLWCNETLTIQGLDDKIYTYPCSVKNDSYGIILNFLFNFFL